MRHVGLYCKLLTCTRHTSLRPDTISFVWCVLGTCFQRLIGLVDHIPPAQADLLTHLVILGNFPSSKALASPGCRNLPPWTSLWSYRIWRNGWSSSVLFFWWPFLKQPHSGWYQKRHGKIPVRYWSYMCGSGKVNWPATTGMLLRSNGFWNCQIHSDWRVFYSRVVRGWGYVETQWCNSDQQCLQSTCQCFLLGFEIRRPSPGMWR